MKVGIDSVDLDRIEKSLEIKGFTDKVYSLKERVFLAVKKDPVPSAAGNFAAKEAFSKALGTGVRGFALNEVSILRDDLGAPYIELLGRAKEAAQGTNNAAAAEKDLANGFVNINGGIYEINDFATNATPATIAR